MTTRCFGSCRGVLRTSSLVALAIVLMTALGAHSADAGGSPSPPHGPALWVANEDGNFVAEFTGNELTASGMQSPSRKLASADLDEPWGIIFGSSKQLWVSNVGNGTLTKFTFKQLKDLKTDDAPSAAVVISGLDRPEGMVFDGKDMWVADEGSAQLFEFTSSQLAASGSPTPDTVINSSALMSPVGIALDHSGNLWVADDGASEIFMFTKAQLAAGGTQSPTVTLSSDGSDSLDSCEPILFDGSGNLWATNNSGGVDEDGSVVKFTPAQLKASGSPTPAVMLTATTVTDTTASSFDDPAGITFDDDGNLWVANVDSDEDGSIAKFSKGAIKADGSPQPSVFIDSNSGGTNLDGPFFLVFGPKVP